jgi:hypothetical protein
MCLTLKLCLITLIFSSILWYISLFFLFLLYYFLLLHLSLSISWLYSLFILIILINITCTIWLPSLITGFFDLTFRWSLMSTKEWLAIFSLKLCFNILRCSYWISSWSILIILLLKCLWWCTSSMWVWSLICNSTWINNRLLFIWRLFTLHTHKCFISSTSWDIT